MSEDWIFCCNYVSVGLGVRTQDTIVPETACIVQWMQLDQCSDWSSSFLQRL